MSNQEADENDIYYAYRLLLGREPDAGGLEHYRQMLGREHRTPCELASSFLVSLEFAERNKQLPVEVKLDGYSVFVGPRDRDIGASIQIAHQYEPHVTAVIREMLRPGNVFVDVGANIGFFTNLAAHLVGASGRVVAIEPMDKNLQLIYRSLESNGFGHVDVHACAASDCQGIVCVTTGPGTSNGQVVKDSNANGALLRSQTRRLDDLTVGLAKIDLVKFDIEGYELLAWRGFREGLQKHRPVVLTEFHPFCMREYVGIDPRDYLDELFRYSGRIMVLGRDGLRHGCAGPADVMRYWEMTDKSSGGNGTDHLDLLIQPEP